ncbi:MAG: XRE family transcriptional regulator [Ruminococcus sp.]|nr:XRE family transcriptional regulator [Ruminococcus sp.]
MKKKTQELIEIIKQKDSVEDYFAENAEEIMFDDLTQILELFLRKKGLTKSEALDASQIEKHYGYQIFSGLKTPSRDKVVMLCFGLGLSLDEVQQVLKKAGYGELYPRDRRDSVIIFAFHHKLSVMETNEILYELRIKILE